MDFRLAWVVLGLVAGVLELLALARSEAGDTLSEQVWALLELARPRHLRILFWLTWAWLTWHFFFTH